VRIEHDVHSFMLSLMLSSFTIKLTALCCTTKRHLLTHDSGLKISNKSPKFHPQKVPHCHSNHTHAPLLSYLYYPYFILLEKFYFSNIKTNDLRVEISIYFRFKFQSLGLVWASCLPISDLPIPFPFYSSIYSFIHSFVFISFYFLFFFSCSKSSKVNIRKFKDRRFITVYNVVITTCS